jgi:MFS family permease
MLAPAQANSKPAPLAPALIAMTALQVLVSGALFAPGIMAPSIGIDPATLGFYTTAACAVGIFTAFAGGMLAARYGGFRVASACAVLVFAAMGVAILSGASALLILVGFIMGFAFGPETPASSSVLSRVATPALRPLVFSIRQTGNQIGAVIGSLTLPWIAAVDPAWGYAAFMAFAVVMLVAFESLRPVYDPMVRGPVIAIPPRAVMRVVSGDRDLLRLALAALPFSAMQVALNVFLVTYGVSVLKLGLVAAGLLLAVAQTGGLIGRIGFGLLATRVPGWGTVMALGFAMSALAVVVGLAEPGWPWPLLLTVAFFFGLTASGWNGVALAEVARLAPEGRVAEATGAALVSSYSGLVLGPLLIAGIAGWFGLGAAYGVLGVATFAGALLMAGKHR